MNCSLFRTKVALTLVCASLGFTATTARAATVTWNVAGGGAWDTVTGNWTGGSPTANLYVNGDTANFNNTAGGTITLSGTIAPTATNISAASGTYTFAGTGITTGTLTKSGAGTLTITNANTFTGLTTVNGNAQTVNLNNTTGAALQGNLQIGTTVDAAVGIAVYTLAANQFGPNSVVSFAGTSGFPILTLKGNNQTIAGLSSAYGLAFVQNTQAETLIGNSVLTINNSSNFSYSGVIRDNGGGSGTLALIKEGGGTQTINGTGNSYTGGTTVNAGALTLGAAGSNGSIRGSLTINSGGTVNADANSWSLGYGTSTSVSSILINGGTLNFTNASTAGGTDASSIAMTGGLISGAGFAWYGTEGGNGITNSPTLTTNAAATTATISAPLFLRLSSAGNLTFNVAPGSVPLGGPDLLVSGAISNATFSNIGGNITKSGSGTAVFSGANTYTGTTSVTAGTLLTNTATGGTNSATGVGAVSVGASGTLGGTGQVRPTGTNAISVNGTLAPGASIGTLTIDSAGSTAASILTMASGSLFKFELGAAGVSLASFGTSDRLAISNSAVGDVTFNNNTINFLGTGANGFYKLFDTSLANATPGGDTWNNLTYDGTTGVVSSGLVASNLVGIGTFIVGTSGNGGDLGDIYLSVVPEPSSFAMLMFGSVILWLVGKKRRC